MTEDLEHKINKIKKVTGRVITAIGLGVVLGVYVYFNYLYKPEQVPTEKIQTPTVTQQYYQEPETQETLDEITFTTFNIQVFGESKSNKPEVMEVLTKTFCESDLVAVQEIRNKNNYQNQLRDFLSLINQICEDPMDYVASLPLGDSTSVENYAFFFDTSALELLDTYQYTDPNNQFSREPYSAWFKVLDGNLDFVAVNFHIKPDDNETKNINETYSELMHLNDVYRDMQRVFYQESDFIFAGDFNADCTYLNFAEWQQIQDSTELINLVPEDFDTTVSSTDCTYDRLMISPSMQEDLVGDRGDVRIFNYALAYNLNQELEEDVSDHYPVSVDFYNFNDSN